MNQCERVLTELIEKRQLTQFEAIGKLGILRLASRIDELRKEGYDIVTMMIDVKNRFGEKCRVASYSLE
jgi:predicted XRE-type DNA-binding protein